MQAVQTRHGQIDKAISNRRWLKFPRFKLLCGRATDHRTNTISGKCTLIPACTIISAVNPSFKLFRLQQIDSQLDQANNRLAEIARELAEDSVLSEAQQSLQTAQHANFSAEDELRQAGEAVKAVRDKFKENQDQLYGGKVKNPKELQDLQSEAEVLTRQLGALEDAELEKLAASEERSAAREAAQANLEAVIAQRGAESQTLGGEQAELQVEVERLTGDRQLALNGVEAEALALYTQLRGSKAGMAVAKVTGDSCSACGMELSAALLQAARSPSELSRCAACKRILYAG